MASLSTTYDIEHDSVHAQIAKMLSHAAYEHSAANYLMKESENDIAHEFATRACRHSMEAAELSKQALKQEQDLLEMLTVAAR